MPPLAIFLFLILLAVVLIASAFAFIYLESRRKKDVAGMLATATAAPEDRPRVTILMERGEDKDFFAGMIDSLDIAHRLRDLISQAGMDWDHRQVLLLMFALGVGGFLLGFKFAFLGLSILPNLGVACLFFALPYLYIKFKRGQRMHEFEEQFPEALDFLARSMRAGHAFSVSLEMLGEESPEPLGREFRTLFNEQNLGANIDVALANFARRVPLLDVRFFVSAVMLQKQTGGNLSEILTRLSYIIRERFRLKGQVKAASAHGRITALILTVMPIVVGIALLFVSPGYLQSMARDPDGKYMILAAIVAQLIGFMVMRRIINIKV